MCKFDKCVGDILTVEPMFVLRLMNLFRQVIPNHNSGNCVHEEKYEIHNVETVPCRVPITAPTVIVTKQLNLATTGRQYLAYLLNQVPYNKNPEKYLSTYETLSSGAIISTKLPAFYFKVRPNPSSWWELKDES